MTRGYSHSQAFLIVFQETKQPYSRVETTFLSKITVFKFTLYDNCSKNNSYVQIIPIFVNYTCNSSKHACSFADSKAESELQIQISRKRSNIQYN